MRADKRSSQNMVSLVDYAVLSTILVFSAPAHALSYPCPFQPLDPNTPPPSPELHPNLPDQFAMQVEANIVNKQLTSEAIQVYDYPNKRAVMVITTNNDTVTTIYDYVVGERLDITADGSCTTSDLVNSAFDVFGFTELRTSGPATMLPPAEVFRFGANESKVFVEETVVRGIPVYHWQSCQTMKVGVEVKAAYVMDYYFSKRGYNTASSQFGIPVRILINGTAVNVDSTGNTITGTHNFSHVYEFSFFRSGPADDESLFEVPRGTVCNRKLVKGLPQLPDRFFLSMEVYVPGSWVPPLTERMFFDYDFSLIQTTRYAPRVTGRQFGLTELTIVEDYANQVQYVIDAYDGNCSISAMPHDLSTSINDGNKITMKHGTQLLNYGKQNFKYQGQKWFRDMKVDVWAASGQDGMVQEVYFLADWPSARMLQRLSARMGADVDVSSMNLLVGTYLANTSAVSDSSLGPMFRLMASKAIKQWGDNWQPGSGANNPPPPPMMPRPGQLLRSTLNRHPGMGWRLHMDTATEKFINVFNYLPMHMDMSAFDVSMCYKKSGGEQYVYFTLDGSYSNVVTNQRYSFFSSAKAAIARAAGISSLRMTKINIWQDLVHNRLNFVFSLLDPPPVGVLGPDDHVHEQLSSKEALAKLEKVVQDGLTIVVKHLLHTTTLQVVPDSIKSWPSLEELWGKVLPSSGANNSEASSAASTGQAATAHSDGSSYSQGQFGGMAFGMLLLGALLGIGGLYVVIWRLRPDIHLLPYQQSK